MSTHLQRLRSDGFVDLGLVDPTRPPADIAGEVAASIGAVVVAAHEQLEVSSCGTKGLNTYGGNFGLDALPLHTDLAHWHRPPRYVLLRSIVGSTYVHTKVLHRRELEPWIPVALMKRAMFSPRRRLEGKMYLLHMQTEELLRWDQLFLEPKNAAAIEVRQRMLDVLPSIDATNIALVQPGHTLLIDNWHALHGRGSVPASEATRRLERTYLEDAEDGHKDPT